jgi:hypothetical protein
MFITPEITELPATVRKETNPTTRAQADEFFRTLLMANHQWVKFWEADISELTLKQADALRSGSRNFIFSSAMSRYIDQIDYTTRKRDGILTAYARIK